MISINRKVLKDLIKIKKTHISEMRKKEKNSLEFSKLYSTLIFNQNIEIKILSQVIKLEGK